MLKLAKNILLRGIRLYQKTLSPDHGVLQGYYPFGCCRFQPTCSEYTYQAVDTHGIARGLWLGGRRLLKCNPLHPGGIDPLALPRS